ncbi:MAG TPA: hypothetical protein VIZ60_18720 [Rubrobacter sp.]
MLSFSSATKAVRGSRLTTRMSRIAFTELPALSRGLTTLRTGTIEACRLLYAHP